jgi:hypothetical protein
MPFKPPMLANSRIQLGFVAAAAPMGWALVANIGVPLLIGAGIIAITGTAVKSAIPEIPINRDKIGVASLVGGGGVAAYYLSGLLPENWKPVAYFGAVAGLALSGYFLFSPGEKKPPEQPVSATILPREVPVGQEVQQAPPGWLSNLLVVQLDPRQERTGGSTRGMFKDQEYAFASRNQSNVKLSFFAGLDIRDDGLNSIFRSRPEPTSIGRKMFAIPSGGTLAETLMAPPINFWFPQTITVTVQFFRKRDDLQPFLESDPIPVKMAYL